MISSIITNKKIDKTFTGVDCFLKRTIIKKTQKLGSRDYLIKTEKVIYEDELLPVLDKNGDVQYDEKGNLIESLQEVLTVVEQKDGVSIFKVTDADADNLYNAIKENVLLEGSYSEFERNVETLALLYVTQNDTVWGTKPNDWIIYNE
ncbi:hypothetical protein [Psychroserpens mesophilus]|uniref:hypothetical protein n=1 Tax=Psychroserpens mesophilus TaxID=325473 RepID=UPI003D6524C1